MRFILPVLSILTPSIILLSVPVSAAGDKEGWGCKDGFWYNSNTGETSTYPCGSKDGGTKDGNSKDGSSSSFDKSKDGDSSKDGSKDSSKDGEKTESGDKGVGCTNTHMLPQGEHNLKDAVKVCIEVDTDSKKLAEGERCWWTYAPKAFSSEAGKTVSCWWTYAPKAFSSEAGKTVYGPRAFSSEAGKTV